MTPLWCGAEPPPSRPAIDQPAVVRACRPLQTSHCAQPRPISPLTATALQWPMRGMTINVSKNQTAKGSQLATPQASVTSAMLRGASHRCPSCGKGPLYRAFLKVADHCGHCGLGLHHHRADDAPPYFTIFIVGHIILAGVLYLEQTYAPATWIHALIWVPLTLIMTLLLLPRIKGALVGLQWALGMHGFATDAASRTLSSQHDPRDEPLS